MFDLYSIALAVPDIRVANTAYNTQRILEKIRQAAATAADIIALPELAVTGYTCGDLFNQKALLRGALEGLKKIVQFSRNVKKIIVVGVPLTVDGSLFNCAAVIFSGKVIGIVPKTFIPNAREFYEKRWFVSSRDLRRKTIAANEIGLDGEEIPIGSDLVFHAGELTFGVEICEDLWAPLPPSTFLALGGAKLIVNISSSNETIAKREYRRDLVCRQSASSICAYAYVSSGTGESTTDLVFSGHSVVCENGRYIAENENRLDSDYILYGDVDLGKISADRLCGKTFFDCAAMYGIECRRVTIDGSCFGQSKGENLAVDSMPFVPKSQKDRLERCMAIFDMQKSGLKKRLEHTGSKPVVGVSGGLDSTLALLVCAAAMKKLGRPLTDIHAVTMPCFGTSGRTYKNALELMKTLGVTAKEINIKQAVRQHFASIGQSEDCYDLTYENSQARERTQVLMDYAGKVGGLVVGTGDLSELALGWCTYNADHMSMYGVNAGVPKTLVKWMIDSVIALKIFPESENVLKDIVSTPISPELLPPDENGEITQQTQDLVGPYVLHDFFLYYVLRYGFEPEKIFFLAKKAFDGAYDADTIKKWLKSFYKRFFSQQFKRSCLPDGVKIGSVSLSPRGDWRMPSDADAELWLAK